MIHSHLYRIATVAAVVGLGTVSCGKWGGGRANSSAVATQVGTKAVVTYKAISGVPRSNIPNQVYLFPPLLSNARGVPVESMRPVLDADGEISEWSAPSTGSETLRRAIAQRIRELGFEVVSFSDLVESESAFSTLVVSSFYTKESSLESAPPGGLDRSMSVMIQGSLFDSELDPKSKKDIVRVDGVINFSSQDPIPSPLARCFSETARWFGDNVNGSAFID